MIIEFVGLPGCGKSTLQTAMIEALAADGQATLDRFALQQRLIRQWIPLNRSGPLRRLSSAMYKGRLAAAAMGAGLLRAGDITRKHLVRGAQRVLESRLMYEKLTAADAWWVLDEGLTQNFCALRVWQRLLGPGSPVLPWSLLEQHYRTHPHCLVHVQLPAGAAEQRLLQRGRPVLWPESVPTAEVIDAFDDELQIWTQTMPSETPGVDRFEVDADLPLSQWPAVAKNLIASLDNRPPHRPLN